MNLKKLSNQELIDYTKAKAASERKIYTEVLEALHEIEKRKAYFEEDCNSLFMFCVKVLKYERGPADRRVKAMRALYALPTGEFEKMQSKIQSGSLNLTHLSAFQRASSDQVLTTQKRIEILEKLENKTEPESEKILLEYFPGYEPRKESVKIINAEGDVRLHVTLDAEAVEYLEKLIHLTAHRNPYAKKDVAIKLALKTTLDLLDPRKIKKRKEVKKELEGKSGPDLAVRQNPTRIKAKDRRELFRRSMSCEDVNPKTGKVCGDTFMPEADHVIARANGGQGKLENLQVLCRNHNQYKSNRVLGVTS